MSDNLIHQDAAVLKLLNNYAAEIEQNELVDGIDESNEDSLEESVLSKTGHIDAAGYVSFADVTVAKKSNK